MKQVKIMSSVLLLIFVCPFKIKGQLRREDVAEGPCIIPYPKATTVDFNFLITTLLNVNTPFYVPMGSKHLYRSYATYLLGRPANSEVELAKMKLRIRGSIIHRYKTMGYDASFIQQCILQGDAYRANCFATNGSPGTDLTIIRQTTDTLVYTDQKSVFLFVCCVMGKENDWKLLSNQATVDEDVKKIVINKVQALGFTNSSNYAEMIYNNC